ncbi:MAG: penicillin-binding transpeptidase domain-containing protein, partial [Endozoicomonadaceae bacterium]|nr:penicillin-binding transpeptidase domain-containing protein [Endozoicomonadaceae bacterium]
QKKLVDLLGDFGFGKPTGINFPGEAIGYVPFEKKLSKAGLSNLSFGYHLSVTPLQMIRAYSGLALGGVLPVASLLKQDVPQQGVRVISRENAQQVVDMLKQTVEHGTGKKAQISGYTVAGKTGTSHKAEGEGYNRKSYYSSFIGMAPANNPKLVMVVILNDVKKGSYYGGQIAGPVFSRLAGTTLRLLGVTPDKMATIKNDLPVNANANANGTGQ